MKQLIVIALFLISLTDTEAQNINNLVVNPSFELLRNDSCLRRGRASISEFPGWFDTGVLSELQNGSYGKSSPDAFHKDTCEMPPFWSSLVPLNNFGFQETHHGNGYAGFVYGSEYLSGTLNQDLIAGNTYCLKAYVSLAEASWSSTNVFTIMFHIDSVLLKFPFAQISQIQSNNEVINKLNPLFFRINNYLNDTLNWLKLETEFIADSAYRFFTFGNFRSLTEMNTLTTRPEGLGRSPFIYFYLDNISIYDCSDTIPPPEPTFAFEVKAYPNPASDWFNFDYTLPEAGKVRIHVTDVFGKIVLARTELQGQKGVNTFAIDATPWAMGRYHISVLYEANGRSEYRHLKHQIIR